MTKQNVDRLYQALAAHWKQEGCGSTLAMWCELQGNKSCHCLIQAVDICFLISSSEM